MVTYWATHCACWLVELRDLAKVKANKFNSLRQTALWEEAFTSRLTDTCSGSNFYQVKGCSWTSGHTELRGQFTILRLWVGVAVWEVQNGNYFLSIKPHSPPKTTRTELTLQLVVKTSVTATVMKTLLIFTSYPDVMSMNLSKLDALLFLAVMWLMGTVFFSRKKTIPIWKNANVCGISEQSCDDCVDMTPLVNFSNVLIWCFRPTGIGFLLYSIGGKHFR